MHFNINTINNYFTANNSFPFPPPLNMRIGNAGVSEEGEKDVCFTTRETWQVTQNKETNQAGSPKGLRYI